MDPTRGQRRASSGSTPSELDTSLQSRSSMLQPHRLQKGPYNISPSPPPPPLPSPSQQPGRVAASLPDLGHPPRGHQHPTPGLQGGFSSLIRERGRPQDGPPPQQPQPLVPLKPWKGAREGPRPGPNLLRVAQGVALATNTTPPEPADLGSNLRNRLKGRLLASGLGKNPKHQVAIPE